VYELINGGVGGVGYFDCSVFEQFCDIFGFFSDVCEPGLFGGVRGGVLVFVCFGGSDYGCCVIFVIA
jgi:hypothetical protein